MKKCHSRIFAFALAFCIFAGLSAPAAAAWEDFSDAAGHWAEPVLERAYSDGLIQGFEDGTLRPDEPITAAQMAAILCRVLSAQKMADDYAAHGLSGDEWYAEAAMKSLALGLFDDLSGIESPMTREDALVMMTRAFQLFEAEPDFSALEPFSDASALRDESRGAMAVLVSSGYVQGYAGSLNINGSISRAEFLAVLYRVASNYTQDPGTAGALSGGTVISEVSGLTDLKFDYPVWMDCSTSGVTLQNVTAPLLVLRSQNLSSVNIAGATDIDRLVLASGGSGNLSVSPFGSAAVGTLVVGDTASSVSLGGGVKGAEITGSGKTVTINGKISGAAISGSGNTVTINPGVSVGYIRVAEGAKNNKIIVNGSVSDLTDLGGSDISGYGNVTNASVNSALGGSVSVRVTNLTDLRDGGIEGAELGIEAPESLPAGETLKARAALSAPESASGKAVNVDWYIDGELVKSETAVIGPEGLSELEHNFKYSREMPAACKLRCVVGYTTNEGSEQSVSAEAELALENYGDDYYEQYDKDAVLARVSTGYKGNYTLDWALNNDYDAETKTVWVNAKGYSSTTEYLIWVSLAYQRVNIFSGSKGSWELEHEFLCASGAPGSATPVGVYTVFGRQTGWFTSSYTCRPVVNFKTGSGYAFHSRLYKPGWSEEFTDARIGFPVSHGCLRMYSEDITWMYNSIPTGTTVVVF